MQQERLTYLIGRIADKAISVEETAELKALLNTHDVSDLADKGFAAWLNERLPVLDLQGQNQDIQLQVNAILSVDKSVPKEVIDYPDSQISNKPSSINMRTAHRIHFLRKWGWAAAVVFILGSAAYLWTTSKKTEQPLANGNKHLQMDIAPGSNKAILTLSNGRTITLDSAANGAIAQQGNSSIIKSANGGIRYDQKGLSQGEVMINTMTTPRGGQYQLILPDGSKVWLNAASSITYPAVFVGKKRNVTVTGEVYFEVSKNREKPFVVDINGKSSVEVLGTSFNVNSYADENTIKTTLLEGSIKVKNQSAAVTLKPGQQAEIVASRETVKVNTNIDLVQVMGWKNGFFHFKRTNITEVMRQMARWYDVEIRYESGIPDIALIGEMKRDLSLGQVLEALKEMGVKCQLHGRSIIVQP